jgi:hypothetical protein
MVIWPAEILDNRMLVTTGGPRGARINIDTDDIVTHTPAGRAFVIGDVVKSKSNSEECWAVRGVDRGPTDSIIWVRNCNTGLYCSFSLRNTDWQLVTSYSHRIIEEKLK